ncbi:MAG: HipA domain-containing protein [Bacteroidales bacterium]|nr:HipA domain-containing protein [Bacteroidales bacterium]
MEKQKRIKSLPITDYSGYSPKLSAVGRLKNNHYRLVTDIAITGDAPKDFLRIYEYGNCRKNNLKTWPLYLAKLCHKHYPIESITEYLLNKIGEYWGFDMASSKLYFIGEQIRFFSKYFLKNPDYQKLEHGAELYAGYLNDRIFVEEIEKKNQARDFFTVNFTKEVIRHFYPQNFETIYNKFLELLLFDALIGNNDRHFYNWGVISDLNGIKDPYFSPFYDTARALFWNYHEETILNIFKDKNRRELEIRKYSDKSFPKIGWESERNLNHFKLMEKIALNKEFNDIERLDYVFSGLTFNNVLNQIEKDFSKILSSERINLILCCLSYRFKVLRKIFNFAP